MDVTYEGLTNELELLDGDSIKINDYLSIHHPTVREILTMGENEYYNRISTFVVTPYDCMVELYDKGEFYSDLTNWDLFVRIFNSEINRNSPIYGRYKYLLGDYEFVLLKQVDLNRLVFYCKDYDFIIDELIYIKISNYLKLINSIPVDKKNQINPSKNKHLAKILVKELVKTEKEKRLRKKHNDKKNILLSYVNKLVWATNRSYSEILNMKLYQFKMGIKVLSDIKSYEEMKLGYFTGNMDTKKTRMSNFDWLHNTK